MFFRNFGIKSADNYGLIYLTVPCIVLCTNEFIS